jgi:DASS family divalent anion:Na+ symporter
MGAGRGLPGIIMLLLTPLITYKLYPPELKRVDNKRSLRQA